MSSYKNVIVKGDPLTKEGTAGGTITPGMLLTYSTTTVIAHNSATGGAIPMFALENSDIGDGVDDNYSSGDNVKFAIFRPGDELQALLANAQTVAVGDQLVSNGDGTLKKYSGDTVTVDLSKTTSTYTTTVQTQRVVARALEAMTASGTSKILVEAV